MSKKKARGGRGANLPPNRNPIARLLRQDGRYKPKQLTSKKCYSRKGYRPPFDSLFLLPLSCARDPRDVSERGIPSGATIGAVLLALFWLSFAALI